MRNGPLSALQREQISDARLLLETASHNLQALLRGEPLAPGDLDQSLANAQEQLAQVQATLIRLRAGRSSPRP